MTKRRTLIVPLVALATLALMLSATGASAAPHETVGELAAECTVDGSVSLSDPDTGGGGLDNNRSNNDYTFRDTTLECTAVTNAKLEDNYDVSASGTTADYLHQKPGENCDEGGSEKVGDEVHTGSLSATALGDGNDMTGSVHFVRLGTTVLADGPLEGGQFFFQAELEFVPLDGDCVNDPVENAALIGTGEVYQSVEAHNCSADSTKVSDPHCF